MLAIVGAFVIPIIVFSNTIGRPKAMNEFQYIIHQLLQGDIWSYLVVIGLLFLVGWWVVFFVQVNGVVKE
ncbi:hypothetical protein [Oceanobacillus sp. CAU 1775]